MTHRFSQLARYTLTVFTVFLAALFSIGSAFAEKVLYTFPYTGENGLHPQAKLVYRSGKLYGTTQQGGGGSCAPLYTGCGVVFEVSESTGSTNFRLLYAFKGGKDVSTPVGNIVFDAAGNLYGVASGGGMHNLGGIFKLAPGMGGNWTETIVHSFAGPDGQVPRAGLTIDATGNVYGTASSGGVNGWGLVFELSPDSHGEWTESILYNFQGSPDGAVPWGEVSFDSQGNIYGTTGAGGENASGAVYELVPSGTGGWKESVIYAGFKNAQIGYPHSELLLASTGDIFGVGQGDGEGGEVFHLTQNNDGSWTETTIFIFGAHSGVNPYGGLAMDAEGNLYGTTPNGGFYDLGTVYRLSPGSGSAWTHTTIHSFAAEGRGDGENPEAGLMQGEPGVYYGTTFGELQEGTEAGTVFTIKP
jgi:uncharacterized repeat protein (TIGR03803 family)